MTQTLMLTLLATNVKAARIKQGLTQEQLAEAVNLTTLSISNIERAAVWPKPETLELLLNVLHLRPYELFLDTARDAVISKEAFNSEIKLLIEELQSHTKTYESQSKSNNYIVAHSKRESS